MAANEAFFFGAPCAILLFLLGAGWNLHVFQRKNILYLQLLDLPSAEVPSPRSLWKFTTMLALIWILLVVTFKLRLWGDDRPELVPTVYSVIVIAIFIMPFDICHRSARKMINRTIGKCIWPWIQFDLPPQETPFLQVLIADGLTSLSKMFQDFTIAMMMSIHYLQGHDYEEDYTNRMRSQPLPYIVASLPYLIRAQQCIVSYKRTKLANDKFLHVLNTLKYSSGLLVIAIGALPRVMEVQYFDTDGVLFILCAFFNSAYSFLWDIVMDWGLGQPDLPPEVKYLRPKTKLIYGSSWKYYLAMLFDLGLRILWVTKWWEKWRGLGADFKFVAETAEVLRRVMWNCFRLEWQSVKTGILADMHRNSGDGEELLQDAKEIENHLDLMSGGTGDLHSRKLSSSSLSLEPSEDIN